MRGKPDRRNNARAETRIIPAHAGQTCRFFRMPWLVPDHPRACGANPRTRPTITRRNGSSPRMRGKHTGVAITNNAERIIPAHAGQTPCALFTTDAGTDHPRACGANHTSAWRFAVPDGSSPRMRGKQRQYVRMIKHADHPRACGANVCVSLAHSTTPGSSPRMRGKLVIVVPINATQRIIPAHAGQTKTD